MNTTYRRSNNLKAVNVPINWTPELILEYQKCLSDPIHFIKNHMKILHLDRGIENFHPYPYQEKMINNFNTHRFNIVLACRQSGKSSAVVGYALWYAIAHSNQQIVILANKGETAREILSRFSMAYENLPFFLQVGVKSWNKGSIELGNGTKIYARATHANSVRGLSINLCIIDEFAFIDDAEKFYTSTYPVISSGQTTKIILISTANGMGNPFHRLWEAAVEKRNAYIPFRVDWWDVPGRDEKWKKETIDNTSEIQFIQEYGNDFLATGDTLISTEALLALKSEDPIEIKNKFKMYEKPQKNHTYIITVDVAQGVGNDYSAFSVIDITQKPYKQVASYYDNSISPLLFGTILNSYGKYFNTALIIVENNDQGSLVCYDLYYELEYENLYTTSIVKSDGIGIKQTKKTKKIGCAVLKDLVESYNLKVVDSNTINELKTFVAKNNSFEASDGNHDDLCMSLVLFSYFSSTQEFENYEEKTLKSILHQEKINQFEDQMLPMFVSDGREDEYIIDSDNQVWETVDF